MRKLLLLILLNVFATNAYSFVDTKCSEDYKFVVDYIENNSPAFSDNVNNKTRPKYEKLKADLEEKVKTVSSENDCAKYLVYYIEFFNDNHTYLRIPANAKIDESDEKQVAKFLESELFKNRETYDLKESQLQNYPLNDVRGIYETADASYKVAVIKSKDQFRDLIGVIIDSKSKLWKEGQVKFELKKKKENLYEGFFYSRNHSLLYKTVVPFNDGIFGDNWFKSKIKNKVNHSLNRDRKTKFEVKDDVAYLRIPTFSGRAFQELDKLYKESGTEIHKTPYLIIDVRNNGGGSDTNVLPLIDFFYTKPMVFEETLEVWVSDKNKELYKVAFEDTMKEPEKVSPQTVAYYKELMKILDKAKPNTFASLGGDSRTVKGKSHKYPQKVAILYNRGCASSCETLLFLAQKAEKAILVGENSGGYVGYGNIFSVKTPQHKFTIQASTTRYKNARKYEVVGVSPDYRLDYKNDWIEQTKKILRLKAK